MEVEPAAVSGVRRIHHERRPSALIAQPIAIRQAEAFVHADGRIDFIRSFRFVRARANQAHAPVPPRAGDEVFPVDFVKVRAFAHAGVFRKKNVFGAGHNALQIGRQLSQMNILISPDNIGLAIIVKQH